MSSKSKTLAAALVLTLRQEVRLFVPLNTPRGLPVTRLDSYQNMVHAVEETEQGSRAAV